MYKQYTLDNGAKILLVPQYDTKSVTSMVMFPVGSRYESEKLSGVSHYIEHLMFKGTKKRKNTLTLTREIDRLGAEYNAFTSKEYTGYYIKAASDHLNISLDILSDMLLNSVFDPKEMEREKGPIIEELNMYQDNPMMNLDTVFEQLMFKGSPLARDIGGTPKHVKSYKRPDVLAYKEKYYDVSNMTIVIGGNIPENIDDLIQKYFGASKKEKNTSKTYLPATWGGAKKSERIIVEHKKTDQAQMMLGFPAFEYGHKDNVALGMLNTILGGSMSSRLFISIRERKGLAYTVRAGSDKFRDAGYTYVRAGLDPKNINKAIKTIQQEIEKIKIKGVTKRELEDAKMHIKGALTLALEDSSYQVNWYAKEALFFDTISTPEEVMEKYEKVTLADVQRVAKKVFKMNKMRVGIIGNVEAKDIIF